MSKVLKCIYEVVVDIPPCISTTRSKQSSVQADVTAFSLDCCHTLWQVHDAHTDPRDKVGHAIVPD